MIDNKKPARFAVAGLLGANCPAKALQKPRIMSKQPAKKAPEAAPAAAKAASVAAATAFIIIERTSPAHGYWPGPEAVEVPADQADTLIAGGFARQA